MPSITVIGASGNREKFGNKCVRVYRALGWEVFPVNPKETRIEGVKCHASVSGVPKKTDLVSIYLPPTVTISLIPQLAESDIKEVILNPGAESEELLLELKKAGIKARQKCSIRMQGVSPEDY